MPNDFNLHLLGFSGHLYRLNGNGEFHFVANRDAMILGFSLNGSQAGVFGSARVCLCVSSCDRERGRDRDRDRGRESDRDTDQDRYIAY